MSTATRWQPWTAGRLCVVALSPGCSIADPDPRAGSAFAVTSVRQGLPLPAPVRISMVVHLSVPPPNPARNRTAGAAPIRTRSGFRPGGLGLKATGFQAVNRAEGAGETVLAVIIPFESHPQASIDRLLDLVAADMDRVNAALLAGA